MTIEVRQAGASDVSLLARTGSAAFRDAYGDASEESDIEQHIETYFSVASIQSEMQQSNVLYFLAMDAGGECAGLVKVRNARAPGDIGIDNALEVQQLYVSPNHQRKGIGRLLMDSAVRTAGERGTEGVWLSVWSEADWATSFYRSYGFEERGTAPFHLGATVHVDFIMWFPVS